MRPLSAFRFPVSAFRYFFFFPPGITLATALTIEPATFATTPFLAARFLAFAFGFADDFDDLDLGAVRVLGAVFVFAFFFAAVLAIRDSLTP